MVSWEDTSVTDSSRSPGTAGNPEICAPQDWLLPLPSGLHRASRLGGLDLVSVCISLVPSMSEPIRGSFLRLGRVIGLQGAWAGPPQPDGALMRPRLISPSVFQQEGSIPSWAGSRQIILISFKALLTRTHVPSRHTSGCLLSKKLE